LHHRGDFGLNVLDSKINIAVELKFDRHGAFTVFRPRRDAADALNGHHRVLNDIDNGGFDNLRRCAFQTDIDGDHRIIHVRKLAYSHAHKADPAEYDEPEHKHPGKDRPFYGDL